MVFLDDDNNYYLSRLEHASKDIFDRLFVVDKLFFERITGYKHLVVFE